MRVWALASCGGLLALAACSAEQSSSPNPVGGSPDGNDTAQVNAQLGLTATPSSPMARPEVGRRQVLRRPLVKPASVTRGVAGQTLPQSAQLRERLQRFRAQHGTRLAPNTALVTTPIPAARLQAAPNPQPTPIEANIPARAQSPSPVTPISAQGKGTSSSESIALPTLPRPTRPSQALGDAAPLGSAADLGPLASASVTTSYPIAPLRHQGYSARPHRPAPVLTAPNAALVERGGVPVAAVTPRLHGEPSGGLQARAGAASPEGPPTAAATVPAGGGLPPTAAASTAPSVDVPPADGPSPLTVAPGAAAASSEAAAGHRSQDVTLRPEHPVGIVPPVPSAPVETETAIAPAESLSLHGSPPRVYGAEAATASPVLSRPPSAAPVGDSPPTTIAQPLTVAPGEAVAPTAAPMSAPQLESSPAPLAHHLEQPRPEPVRLAPSSNGPAKSQPTVACSWPSGLAPGPETNAQATAPQFSRPGGAGPELSSGAGLAKEGPSPGLCAGDGLPTDDSGLEETPTLTE